MKGVGHGLPQACAQLARGTMESLDTCDVYDLRRDPAESVTEAVLLLNQALRKAAELGDLLEAAVFGVDGALAGLTHAVAGAPHTVG